MNPRKREEVQTGLLRKGFERSNNDHAKFIYWSFSGKKTSVWTKTSFGSSHKDITANNLSNMAKQCKLSNKDFIQLLDCPLTRENYEEKLITSRCIHS